MFASSNRSRRSPPYKQRSPSYPVHKSPYKQRSPSYPVHKSPRKQQSPSYPMRDIQDKSRSIAPRNLSKYTAAILPPRPKHFVVSNPPFKFSLGKLRLPPPPGYPYSPAKSATSSPRLSMRSPLSANNLEVKKRTRKLSHAEKLALQEARIQQRLARLKRNLSYDV
jgi:hypothetical protein